MIKDVALLLRISRDKGENQDTLQNHRERLTRLCNERGYNITATYEEIASGQAKLESREQLNELLSELNQYDAVVIIDTSRLSRDLEFSIHLWKRFEQAGIPIITPERIYTENDFTQFAIESTLAHGEYKQIAKRMKQNKIDRLRRGEWVQGKPPIGYVRDANKKLVINESEAQIVRTIYNLAQEGHGLEAITKRLGYHTAKGKPFTMPTIRNILKNPVYKGTIAYNVMDASKTKIKETITCKNAHESIINKQQWDAVQLALQGRFTGDYETRNRNKGKVLSILHSLVYCGQCGLKLGFRTDYRYKKNVYLRECKCRHAGCPEHRLVEQFMSEFEFLEGFYRDEWKKALETLNGVSKESLKQQIYELNKTTDKLNKRLKGYKIMRADGELTKVDYEELKGDTETELKRINAQIDELNYQLQSTNADTLNNQYEAKIKLIKRINECYGNENIVECNRLLKLIINKVLYSRVEKKVIITSPLEGNMEVVQGDYIELFIDSK
ncbi:recombinase family protein [Bacillus sp. AFS031507]|uniref:recombinase family protein n=1 Tax=Bacillus sp. AFS031507 TaxID=2033496 RepID=UPI0015D4724E|nr:recombinase family protein [Bacillus sp. AFS031507]